MDLGEKTKEKNQRNILETAERKFKEQGYRQTSMTDIAKDAEVGTGTIYNYFPSKGVLLITFFSKEMEILRKETQIDLPDCSGDFTEQLMRLLHQSLTIIEHYPKSFWRELIPVLTDQSQEHSDLLNKAFQFDMKGIVWFEQLIERYSDGFSVSVDAKQSAFAVYSIMATQTILYIFDNGMTFDQLLANIKEQVNFIFDGKLHH